MRTKPLSFRGFSEPRGARVSMWFEESFGQGAFPNREIKRDQPVNSKLREQPPSAFRVLRPCWQPLTATPRRVRVLQKSHESAAQHSSGHRSRPNSRALRLTAPSGLTTRSVLGPRKEPIAKSASSRPSAPPIASHGKSLVAAGLLDRWSLRHPGCRMDHGDN
jgi:hypothetical protein